MADVEVTVDSSVKQRISQHCKSLEGIEIGYLYGNFTSGKGAVVSCLACKRHSSSSLSALENIDWKIEHDDVTSFFPEGIQICGVYILSSKYQELDSSTAKIVFKELESKFNHPSARKRFVIWQHCQTSEEDHGCVYDPNTYSVSKCSLQFSNIASLFMENILTFRIQASFQTCVDCRKMKAPVGIRSKINTLCDELNSQSTAFYLKDSCMLLRNTEDLQNNPVKGETCQAILNAMASAAQDDVPVQGNRKTNKGKKTTFKSVDVLVKDVKLKDAIDVNLLTNITSSLDNGFVPVLHYQKELSKMVTMSLPIDVVVMTTIDTSCEKLPRMFISAICRQLKQMGNVIQKYSKGDSMCVLKPHHFKPPGYCHVLTVSYPSVTSDGQPVDDNYLESYRVDLHKRFLLPPNKPLLRICNAYIFESNTKPEIYLKNPHCGITSSGLTDGTLGVVDGTYSYHHYMQDSFNDNEWGCAYRSLQTICSWFHLQGYTSKPVPSHREIQQALVDIGDKKANFVGSRQWIGSFEVSMCLEHLLGITSKIMFVNSGAEMASKGRELLHHFQTQGTPVMIGGGVLAHTILGVDFNVQTGDVKFLILDPHYTGSEDLKVILDKGWCGWKGTNFWNQQAHYNMCMPQRPEMI